MKTINLIESFVKFESRTNIVQMAIHHETRHLLHTPIRDNGHHDAHDNQHYMTTFFEFKTKTIKFEIFKFWNNFIEFMVKCMSKLFQIVKCCCKIISNFKKKKNCPFYCFLNLGLKNVHNKHQFFFVLRTR